MSNTVIVEYDTFHEDVTDLYPIEVHDTLRGSFENHRFEVSYQPLKYEEEGSYFGEFLISVYAQNENPLESGGHCYYSERHSALPIGDSFYDLFFRARSIASKIAKNEQYHQCPYCKNLVTEDWKIEKTLPILRTDSIDSAIPINDNENVKTCAGLASWLPPRVEVYNHYKYENPIYDEDELDECDSLLIAPGYPKWRYEFSSNPMSYYKLKTYIDEHPEIFKDDIDIDTVEDVLGAISSHKWSTNLVDNKKKTDRET